MIDKKVFGVGLGALAIATRTELDDATLKVYYTSLSPQIETEEWLAFTRWAIDGDRFPTFFPKLAELRAALREFRGKPPLLVEATEAYERALQSGTYSPVGGTTWSFRSVKEKCGEAAAEAFLAAGGHTAFATEWGGDKRREAFVAAYTNAVRANASAALLPAGPQMKALPSGASTASTFVPSREEAKDLLHVVRRRA